MKSRCLGKWTITKPTNDGSCGFTTYETHDVEEVRAAGLRGWGIGQHIEVDFEGEFEDEVEEAREILKGAEMSHNGVLVKRLLDEAFSILLPESPEDNPIEPHLRSVLGKSFWKILDGEKRIEERTEYASVPAIGAAGAFDKALKETYGMVDAFNPPPAGTYYRGQHDGIVAALKTIADNFKRLASPAMARKARDEQ
ncbi:hypothetical protein [Burkholderia cenocepacia]|uniref:hypothetical protein n=1 Tax=Burkholderia cenocepacia TaxID=95486 RepID=UPI0028756820|nr:hypothetical protein [Burkholderia cenocepacia]MDS0801694.1 hypothetical protein [Burkholderia cenocepacia]